MSAKYPGPLAGTAAVSCRMTVPHSMLASRPRSATEPDTTLITAFAQQTPWRALSVRASNASSAQLYPLSDASISSTSRMVCFHAWILVAREWCKAVQKTQGKPSHTRPSMVLVVRASMKLQYKSTLPSGAVLTVSSQCGNVTYRMWWTPPVLQPSPAGAQAVRLLPKLHT